MATPTQKKQLENVRKNNDRLLAESLKRRQKLIKDPSFILSYFTRP